MTLETQSYRALLSSSEEVQGLNKLLIDILGKDVGVTFDGAGMTCNRNIVNGVLTPPIDAASYDLLQGSKTIGKYEFRLEDGQYIVVLDLSGLEKKAYETVMKAIGRQYPQFSTAMRV